MLIGVDDNSTVDGWYKVVHYSVQIGARGIDNQCQIIKTTQQFKFKEIKID